MSGNDWMIDNRINLSQIANTAEWHRGTVIDALCGHGLNPRDAEAFTCFAFAERAQVQESRPEEYITESQWDRLSLA